MGGYSKLSRIASWSWTDFCQSLLGEVQVTLQRKQTPTIVGIYWQSDVFVYWQEQGRQAMNFPQAGWQAANEQLKNMSEQFVTKFMLQLQKLHKCPGRKMQERMGALENQPKQTWSSHQVTLLNDVNSVAAQSRASARISAGSSAPSVRSSTKSPSSGPTGCEWRRS